MTLVCSQCSHTGKLQAVNKTGHWFVLLCPHILSPATLWHRKKTRMHTNVAGSARSNANAEHSTCTWKRCHMHMKTMLSDAHMNWYKHSQTHIRIQAIQRPGNKKTNTHIGTHNGFLLNHTSYITRSLWIFLSLYVWLLLCLFWLNRNWSTDWQADVWMEEVLTFGKPQWELYGEESCGDF